ncbi:hypothetical protein SDC9_38098 [bioreactor metagenome]|uniref:Uncharacterized protein n=1 Tax=bioreactor metagenome TaxID=1076179 RepID=A0A644VKT3_9ZZZZ
MFCLCRVDFHLPARFPCRNGKRPRGCRGLSLFRVKASVAVDVVPVLALRQLLEGVLGRRARQRPFQRVGVFVPVIRLGHAPASEQRIGHDPEEQQERGEADEGADRGDLVPGGEGFGVVDVAPRHALPAKEVLREEGQIRADEHHPEMQLARPLGILPP